MGSELSAASGRGSEVSEWPRSKFLASAVRQRRNFGHRNRIIDPYYFFYTPVMVSMTASSSGSRVFCIRRPSSISMSIMRPSR